MRNRATSSESATLLIRNLPMVSASKEFLSRHTFLGQYGEIETVEVYANPIYKRSGFYRQQEFSCSVTFKNDFSASVAFCALHRYSYRRHRLAVEFQEAEKKRSYNSNFLTNSEISSEYQIEHILKQVHKRLLKNREILQKMAEYQGSVINEFPCLQSVLKSLENQWSPSEIFDCCIMEDPEDCEYINPFQPLFLGNIQVSPKSRIGKRAFRSTRPEALSCTGKFCSQSCIDSGCFPIDPSRTNSNNYISYEWSSEDLTSTERSPDSTNQAKMSTSTKAICRPVLQFNANKVEETRSIGWVKVKMGGKRALM